jgi:calcineurin-like phosphoesterase family protein
MKNCVRPFKFDCKEKDVFFWGCLHLNHDPKWEIPLWKMRGFNSIQDHNDSIENNWKSNLNENSIIFLLGDTCFGYTAESYMDSFFDRVPFKTCFWMGGNHTAGWNQYLDKSNSNSQVVIGEKIVQLIPNYVEMFINGVSVVACHYPIISWNKQGKGGFMVHAHVHGNLEKTEIGKLLYKLKIKEVSIEKRATPLSFAELKAEL